MKQYLVLWFYHKNVRCSVPGLTDLLLVGRLERCCSSFRSLSQDSLSSVELPCSVYLLMEPLCSCHKPQDLSSPPTVSFISTSFSWRQWGGRVSGRMTWRTGKAVSVWRGTTQNDKWPYLHFVLEDVGVSVHAGVFFQFTQYNAFPEEKDLSLMPSRGGLNFWSLLQHCEGSLKRRRHEIICVFLHN